jgi:hypothetical protein
MLLIVDSERHDPVERVCLGINVRVAHHVKLALCHLKLTLELLINVFKVVVVIAPDREVGGVPS